MNYFVQVAQFGCFMSIRKCGCTSTLINTHLCSIQTANMTDTPVFMHGSKCTVSHLHIQHGGYSILSYFLFSLHIVKSPPLPPPPPPPPPPQNLETNPTSTETGMHIYNIMCSMSLSYLCVYTHIHTHLQNHIYFTLEPDRPPRGVIPSPTCTSPQTLFTQVSPQPAATSVSPHPIYQEIT